MILTTLRSSFVFRFGVLALCSSLVSCRSRTTTDRHPSGHRNNAPIAELDLTRNLSETASGGLFASSKPTFFEGINALQDLEKDVHIRGIFVRYGSSSMGWGRNGEIARSLERLRHAGKKVICHADELGNGTYGLVAQGCDQIWVSPAGGVATVGLTAELVFAHELLEKLGVTADILQVGKFKGTGEMFTRDEASNELKESLGGLLGDLRAAWLQRVTQGRRQAGRAEDLQTALERGPYAPTEAKTLGLIDNVGYADEARQALQQELGGAEVASYFGHHSTSDEGGLADLWRALRGSRKRRGGKAHVALIRASGAIAMDRGGDLLGGSGGIAAKPLLRQLRAIADDASAKAVVLRIDSPGGSALASDLLWHELMLLRARKPLIVSVGDMAASGGYYLACTATKVVAEETSIVGSIGVVGGKFAFGPALRPFGIHVETVSANPETTPGSRASYLSPWTPWDDATRERALASMKAVYELFLQRVEEGRHLNAEQVQSFAEGRVFTGREGHRRGMIDELGGLETALTLARNEAHLPLQTPVRVLDDEAGWPALFGFGGADEDDEDAMTHAMTHRATSLLEEKAHSVLRSLAPELLAYAEARLGPVLRGERALLAMPFAILVR